MSTVFLDTVGLLALWDRNDQWHRTAEAAFDKLFRARVDLVTSSFVLLECGNAAARRPYRQAVAQLRHRLERTSKLIRPTVQDWREAWVSYERGIADNAGIVDHTSFAIMRRLNLRQAFTNDRHFQAAGFETLF